MGVDQPAVLPRLNAPLEFVPRVVSTQSDGRAFVSLAGFPSMRMSSNWKPNRSVTSGFNHSLGSARGSRDSCSRACS